MAQVQFSGSNVVAVFYGPTVHGRIEGVPSYVRSDGCDFPVIRVWKWARPLRQRRHPCM